MNHSTAASLGAHDNDKHSSCSHRHSSQPSLPVPCVPRPASSQLPRSKPSLPLQRAGDARAIGRRREVSTRLLTLLDLDRRPGSLDASSSGTTPQPLPQHRCNRTTHIPAAHSIPRHSWDSFPNVASPFTSTSTLAACLWYPTRALLEVTESQRERSNGKTRPLQHEGQEMGRCSKILHQLGQPEAGKS